MHWLVKKARDYSIDAHKSQLRKFTDLPYFVHCQAVYNTVALFEKDPEILATAFLHDVIEDTPVSHNELEYQFTSKVADDVFSLTNVEKSYGNRRARKLADNKRLEVASTFAKTVKLADILDNVPSMLAFKPSFGLRYLDEKLVTLRYLDSKEKPNQDLYKIVQNSLTKLEMVWKQDD